jgi:membrane protein DedA with SNARE-associated domain
MREDLAVWLAASLSDQCLESSGSIFSVFADWAVSLVETLGAIGVILTVGIEFIFPFIPSEVILPLIGATASTGQGLNFVAALLLAQIGVMLGAILVYWVARAIGLERVIKIAAKIPGLSVEDIEKATKWFVSKGALGVLFGRCVPVIRVLVSIPAGVGRMNFGKYLVYTFVGSLAWNTALMGAGYTLGSNWCQLEAVLDKFNWVILAILVLLLAAYIVWTIRRSKRSQSARKSSDPPPNSTPRD